MTGAPERPSSLTICLGNLMPGVRAEALDRAFDRDCVLRILSGTSLRAERKNSRVRLPSLVSWNCLYHCVTHIDEHVLI